MSVNDSTAAPELPTNRLSYRLDMAILVFGRAISWLWLATMAVVLTNVVNRFILGRGSIAVEELSWHLFGATMILTLAYAVVSDDHVRVDVIREKFSLRAQAWIELAGIALLALPILYLMAEALFEYAYRAFERGEHSQAPSGLPHRFVIKSLIPIGLTLVAVALFSRALRCTTLLFGFPRRILQNTPRH
ncbi:TRAP transporter small permease subunit [Billgrantia bachuensis]|uniref:TRAP transporter small permease protein n=1 Tax=Billgrantia bachuensis TaxID=2717286 RepID=A0ABX0PR76_9GAMM|nr:TRAP transporter small permease subunit [Halomonas bachuensis]NIC05825.1 TRAP transporter small permease subunit [Halomonas bachuensis]